MCFFHGVGPVIWYWWERYLSRVTQHLCSSGYYFVCSLNRCPLSVPMKIYTLFFLLCRSMFSLANDIFCWYFFYYVCRFCIPLCQVGYGGRIESCYTHLCSTHYYFSFVLWIVFDACSCLFIWSIMMYALTSLCISRLDMISGLDETLRFQLQQLFLYIYSLILICYILILVVCWV